VKLIVGGKREDDWLEEGAEVGGRNQGLMRSQKILAKVFILQLQIT